MECQNYYTLRWHYASKKQSTNYFQTTFQRYFSNEENLIYISRFYDKMKKMSIFSTFFMSKIKNPPRNPRLCFVPEKKDPIKMWIYAFERRKKKCWPKILTICEWVEIFNRFQKWCRLPNKDRFKSGGWFTFNHCYQFLTINCNFF